MVIFKFGRDGKVESKPIGYPGGECRKVTAALTEGMGKVLSDVPTDEALLPERQQTQAEQQQIHQ